ncbi:unnamed protein product [Durusdinium trenchii]|uniref:Uncharacterized protein n=1 Tax=Durusdinium trenchii TaxID=1381693 RepID=A0ABP0P888_9DINO
MVYEDSEHWELIGLARENGRLLVILDGFDEAGFLERELAQEISMKLNNEVFLIVTSREMSGYLTGPDFARFRSVRVKELNETQRRQVIQRRLGDPQVVEAFCNQLTLNPALCTMTRNPLLLNVTLSVYETAGQLGAGSLNRGKVYGLALDGMLKNLEHAKAVSSTSRVVTASTLREVLKSIAFLAHSDRNGRGVRDFRRELVHRAIDCCQLGASFDLSHWNEIEDLIKKGRLPLLTWFSESGNDTFRFAHLTFQEFLCAEHCLQMCQEREDFVFTLRDLICPDQPQQIIERGWWQQSIQMFCDLAVASNARENGQCWGSVLGECLLQLGRFNRQTHTENGHVSSYVETPASPASDSDSLRHFVPLRRAQRRRVVEPKTVDFLHLVNDTNILTVLSMLRDSDTVEHLKLGGGLSSSGIATIRTLQVSKLKGLYVNQNYIGPDGCVAIADFMRKTNTPLEVLELVNNVICQGAAKENMLPVSRRNPPSGYYDSYHQELSGLKELLEVIRDHPTMRILDVRGNFLPLQAGTLLAEVVCGQNRLESVCGVDVPALKSQSLTVFKLHNDAYFFNAEYHARQDAPFLSTGGAYFLVQLLLRFPSPRLTTLQLSNQALASDMAGVVQLYDELGQALESSRLHFLDLSGFWDSGAAAGAALGTHLAKIDTLQTIKVGTGMLDLQMIRSKGQSGGPEELKLGTSRMRDCGAGIISQCLPPNVTKINLAGAGVGANGYKILSQCPSLQQIDGVDLSAFKESTTELDFSQHPAVASGSVAAIIARTVLTPRLQRLNLSGCNLTSKSHVHPLTPVAGGSGGIGCNGGCDCRTFEGTNAYKHCADCDLDFCSTCCMSECPMISLAESLQRLPHLVSLKLSDVSFQGGKMGPVRSHLDIEGYRVLGQALREHPNIIDLDLGKNYFHGQGFPYLLQGVVEMKALQTITLGSTPLCFRELLSSEVLEVSDTWLPVEVLLLCMAIRKNHQLRQLHLPKAHSDLKIDVVRSLVDSLRELQLHCEPLELLAISNLQLHLKSLADGSIDSLDLSCSQRINRSALAPLMVFILEHSSGLTSVDFRQNDFGLEVEHLVDAVLSLEKRGLRFYNGIPLQGTAEVFSMEGRQVMPHGTCVFASSFLPRQTGLRHLDLQRCGLDARALSAVLMTVLQIQSVTFLDISGQPLKKAGMEHLASFLRQDKKLQTLRAQNIQTPSYYTAEMLDFTKAMEVNSTLATLDLRGNSLHSGIVSRLQRTMEEKRSVVPLPFDAKICFLLCNRRLPYHLQLPEVAQVYEVSRLFTGGVYSPLFMIFQFCGQPRTLLLDEVQDEPMEPADTAWRPWNRLHIDHQNMGPTVAFTVGQVRRGRLIPDSDDEFEAEDFHNQRYWTINSSEEEEMVDD